MYDVKDVSRFIINYCNDKGYLITNCKLQKILYYVQAMFILTDESTPCFEDDIMAWKLGPAVPESYNAFKHFGGNHIPPITHYYGCFEKDLTPRDEDYYNILEYKTKISHKHQTDIQRMVDALNKYSGTTLTEISMREQPYINAVNSYSKIIRHKDIYDYFISNNEEKPQEEETHGPC